MRRFNFPNRPDTIRSFTIRTESLWIIWKPTRQIFPVAAAVRRMASTS